MDAELRRCGVYVMPKLRERGFPYAELIGAKARHSNTETRGKASKMRFLDFRNTL